MHCLTTGSYTARLQRHECRYRFPWTAFQLLQTSCDDSCPTCRRSCAQPTSRMLIWLASFAEIQGGTCSSMSHSQSSSAVLAPLLASASCTALQSVSCFESTACDLLGFSGEGSHASGGLQRVVATCICIVLLAQKVHGSVEHCCPDWYGLSEGVLQQRVCQYGSSAMRAIDWSCASM